MDVVARLETLDVEDRQAILPEDLRHRAPTPRHLFAPVTVTRSHEGVCMSTGAFAVFAIGAILLVAALITSAVVLNQRN